MQGFLDNFHLLESVNVQFLASLNICGKTEGALCICNGAQRVFETRQKVVTYTARVNSCAGQSSVDAAVRRTLVLGHPFPELLLHLVGVQVELVHFGG